MSIIAVGWDCLTERVRDLIAGDRQRWRSIPVSVAGASHVRQGVPNQDSARAEPASAAARRIVVAVADGHGHAKHFRSDRGSRFAVDAAVDSIVPVLNYRPSAANTVQTVLQTEIPRTIVRAWRDRVAVDYARDEFSREERSLTPSGDIFEAYGSTLTAAVVTEHFLCLLRLGDGDVLTVDSAGQVRDVFPPYEVLGEGTDSLCAPNAVLKFQTVCEPHDASPPAVITLSTDGCSKSFPFDRQDFLKVGSDLSRYLRELGPEKVAQELPAWLAGTSAGGSGDDITLGIIYCVDALNNGRHA